VPFAKKKSTAQAFPINDQGPERTSLPLAYSIFLFFISDINILRSQKFFAFFFFVNNRISLSVGPALNACNGEFVAEE